MNEWPRSEGGEVWIRLLFGRREMDDLLEEEDEHVSKLASKLCCDIVISEPERPLLFL